MAITVRPATDADFPALAAIDLTYPANRYLAIDRTSAPPEHTFALQWRERDAPDELYNTYTVERLQSFRAPLFVVAEIEGRIAGLLTVLLPTWTDAAEIADLAVDRQLRGAGVGTTLIAAATDFARSHKRRALWVEPRANDAPAIDFYIRRGFRISGFNDRLYSNNDDAPGQPTIYLHLELK